MHTVSAPRPAGMPGIPILAGQAGSLHAPTVSLLATHGPSIMKQRYRTAMPLPFSKVALRNLHTHTHIDRSHRCCLIRSFDFRSKA